MYVLLVLWLAGYNLQAQVDSPVPDTLPRRWAIFIRSGYSFGTARAWYPNMRQALKSQNTEADLANIGAIFPTEFGLRWRDWFATFNVSMPIAFPGENNLRHWSASAWLEYSILKSRNYRFNIYGGVSTYESTFVIDRAKGSGRVVFNNLTTQSFPIAPSLSNQGRAFDAGVVLMSRERPKRISAHFSSRFGYRRGFSPNTWKFSDYNATLIGAPIDRINMFYIQTTIGFYNHFR